MIEPAATRPVPTGVKPLKNMTVRATYPIGKPSPIMMRAARKELGLSADETTMIGDTMETDILGAVQMGYRTVLVLSGGTQESDLARYAYRPDIVAADPLPTQREM